MKKLKEYAGVIAALVTVMTAVSSLSLWAIQVQFDGIEARVHRIETDIKTIEGDIKTILLRLPKQPQTG